MIPGSDRSGQPISCKGNPSCLAKSGAYAPTIDLSSKAGAFVKSRSGAFKSLLQLGRLDYGPTARYLITGGVPGHKVLL